MLSWDYLGRSSNVGHAELNSSPKATLCCMVEHIWQRVSIKRATQVTSITYAMHAEIHFTVKRN